MAAKKKEIKPAVVNKEGEPEIPAAILAQHIAAVSDHFEKALNAGLKAHTICVLLKEKTGLPKNAIMNILYWAPRLKQEFTNV